MVKAKWLILDGVWDHIVSHVIDKETTKKMWDALVQLYQNTSEQWKMFMQQKLRSIKMQKGESIDAFLTKILEVHD